MTLLSIVSGQGVATGPQILQLAISLGQAAVELGLRVTSIRSSRSPGSISRYLTLVDHGGRKWLIRISNHRVPTHNEQPLPNLDLVSIDGSSGLHEAIVFLHRIAMGRAIWGNPGDPARRAEYRRARKRRR